MELAVESIASSLDLTGIGLQDPKSGRNNHPKHPASPLATNNSGISKGTHSANSGEQRRKSLPKMQSPSRCQALWKRVYLTVALFWCYHILGYTTGIIGPTLVHLEHLFGTDTAGISKAFIGMNVGFLAGTCICAGTYDRVNHEIQFAMWGMILGVTTACLPWLEHLYTYYAMSLLQYLSAGAMFPAGQAFILKIWSGSSYDRPMLQATFFLWSLGAFSGPFISIPFLENLHEGLSTIDNGYMNYEGVFNGSQGVNITNNSTNSTGYSNNRSQSDILNGATELNSQVSILHAGNFEGVFKIRYIYGIVGLGNFISGFLFLIAFFFVIGPSCQPHDKYTLITQTDEEADEKEKKSKFSDIDLNTNSHVVTLFKVLMLTIILSFIIVFFWHEFVIGSYISAFCIKGLDWTASQGALMASIFYGCHGFGRLTGVLISKYLSPTKVLIWNMTFTTLGLSTLFLSHVNKAVVIIATGVVGFSISTTFPALMLWLLEYMPVTGAIGSVFMAGTGIGAMTSGALVGYLFEEYTYMWVVYISVASSVLCILLFGVLLLVGHGLTYYRDKYKPVHVEVSTQEKALL